MTIQLSEALKNIKKFKNEFQQKRLIEASNLLETIKKVHPCECIVKTSDYYLDYITFYLKNDVCAIKINYDTYRKRYSFHYDGSTNLFKNLSHYQISNIREKFTEPRGVGVLNKKKVADWIKHEQDVYLALKEEDEKLNDKVGSFIKKIENEKKLKWHFYDDKNQVYRGSILKNGIEYNFSIENGYITEKVSINYEVSNSLESFKILSDNKLNRPKKLERILKEV